MKNSFKVLIVIAAFIALGAASTVRISDVVGLYTELANRPKISDGVNPWNYVYSKKQVQDYRSQSEFIRGLNSLGSTIKELPFGVGVFNLFSGTTALTDGACNYTYFELNDTLSTVGIGWVQRTAGVYTADNYTGFSLWSLSGGTATKITQTVDDPALFKVADYGTGTKDWPTPQVLLPGKYVVGLIWSSAAGFTTAPSIYAHGTLSTNLSTTLPNSIDVCGIVTSQTGFPATTLAMSSVAASGVYMGIYFR